MVNICIWNYFPLESDFKTSDLFWGQENWHPRKLYWINYRSWRSLVLSKISKAARDCSHSYSNCQMGLCLLILHPRLTFSNQIISSQCRSVFQLSFKITSWWLSFLKWLFHLSASLPPQKISALEKNIRKNY